MYANGGQDDEDGGDDGDDDEDDFGDDEANASQATADSFIFEVDTGKDSRGDADAAGALDGSSSGGGGGGGGGESSGCGLYATSAEATCARPAAEQLVPSRLSFARVR